MDYTVTIQEETEKVRGLYGRTFPCEQCGTSIHRKKGNGMAVTIYIKELYTVSF